MNKFLFEIGVEELPSSEYKNIIVQLEENLKNSLKNKNIKYKNINIFIAPRRFGAIIDGLEEKQEDSKEERKGPPKNICYDKENKPTKALIGFLKGAGINEDEVVIRKIGNNDYVFAEIYKKGEDTIEVLKEIIPEIILKMNFKKSMKWSEGKFEFVRPVHWVCSLFNDKVVEFEIFNKKSSSKTYGHRFFGDEIELSNVNDYESELEKNYVIPDYDNRIEKIKKELKRIKEEYDLEIDEDQSLIEEIAQLTEYPTGVVGEFKEKYMKLPEEIIIVTVKHHQRSFVAKENNKMSNKFVSFQDGIGREKNIIKGYARVINARLDDAAFYYEDDLKVSLGERFENLDSITYQKGLGTYKDKVLRMEQLSQIIANKIKYENKNVKRAAKLSKIDVTSKVVYEFAELQGDMGRIILKEMKEEEDVYLASSLHYHPIEENDSIPKNLVANVVSLSDRIDDIAGYIGIGKVPTGSKDPFALRRKAFGIFRIIIDKEWELDLKELFKESINILKVNDELEKISDFMSSRFETILLKENMNSDIISTTLINWNRPLRAYLSAQALKEFVEKEEFKEFITAFQRVNNISKSHNSYEYSGRMFKEDAEKELFDKYLEVKGNFEEYIRIMDYKSAINELLFLKGSIDNYFDKVFVMDKDEAIRLNRLGFLKTLANLFYDIGDVTRLYQG